MKIDEIPIPVTYLWASSDIQETINNAPRYLASLIEKSLIENILHHIIPSVSFVLDPVFETKLRIHCQQIGRWSEMPLL